ncbi:hypothetical protein MHYP_G00157290 [Metynnis hypsauchen]
MGFSSKAEPTSAAQENLTFHYQCVTFHEDMAKRREPLRHRELSPLSWEKGTKRSSACGYRHAETTAGLKDQDKDGGQGLQHNMAFQRVTHTPTHFNTGQHFQSTGGSFSHGQGNGKSKQSSRLMCPSVNITRKKLSGRQITLCLGRTSNIC